MRNCPGCSVPMTADNTRPHSGKGHSDGLRSQCRDCENAQKRTARTSSPRPGSTTNLAGAVGLLLKKRKEAEFESLPPDERPTPSITSPGFTFKLPAPRPSFPQAPRSEPADSPRAPSSRGVLERFAIIPDCHHPAAHSDYRVMLRALQVFKPEGLVCLGDFADAASLSAHPKTESERADWKSEVEAINAELDILDRLPGVRWKKYIEGNHENRLSRYLARNARELMGMMSIQECFQLHERGWQFTPYMHHTSVGKIHFTHDTGQAGLNAHRSAQNIFMGSAVIGHTHRMAYEVRGVWGGSPVVTAMFGWLGDPEQITYVHQAAAAMWPRGFGIGYHDTESGLVYMVPVPIVNGTCVVEGVLIR